MGVEPGNPDGTWTQVVPIVGYTVTNARGSGHRGIRDAGWSSSSNVRIEVVCKDEVAQRIARHLRDNYYNDYAMILFESDVRVLRPEKF